MSAHSRALANVLLTKGASKADNKKETNKKPSKK
jgi:hypothetical protein